MTNSLPFRRPSLEPLFVGFAGRMGSGKTSAARYLSSKFGLQYTRYSQVLQEWLSAEGVDRDQLQKLGWDIMAGGLQRELNSRLIAGLDRSRGAAIDGLRHQIDFEELTKALGPAFQLIFLEAAADRRFQRLRSRFSTAEAFCAADSHPVEANIDELKPFAMVTIESDESMEKVYRRLDTWIQGMKSGVDN